jgi:hypothetical protein
VWSLASVGLRKKGRRRRGSVSEHQNRLIDDGSDSFVFGFSLEAASVFLELPSKDLLITWRHDDEVATTTYT